jgi:hypothetical protein
LSKRSATRASSLEDRKQERVTLKQKPHVPVVGLLEDPGLEQSGFRVVARQRLAGLGRGLREGDAETIERLQAELAGSEVVHDVVGEGPTGFEQRRVHLDPLSDRPASRGGTSGGSARTWEAVRVPLRGTSCCPIPNSRHSSALAWEGLTRS